MGSDDITRQVRMSVLPGEPKDGSGKICIHLFLKDDRGPFVEPHVLHPALDEHGEVLKQQMVAKPTRGRLACDPKRQVAPKTDRHGVTTITVRTDDPQAVTCPKCIKTKEYAELMSKLEQIQGG